ncbi:MAG: M48 family metalloprotease [Clostridiales bacterium]|nr:M48 family metalloprotease [Clostridiales bacterium]
MPLFEEVYHRAKKADSSLPDGIRIFINDEEEAPGAFAIGRRTLCVTRSLLALPDEMIKAAIGHEFGHLAHKDTDRILLVSVGNVFVTALFIFLKVVVIAIGWLFKIIGYLTFIPGLAVLIHLISTGVTYLLILLLHVLMLAWNGMGTLLCMKTNKGNEYSADRFSLELGYGDALCRVLLCTGGARLSGLFASLSSGHSDNEERVKRLIELGTVCDQLN